MTSPLLELRALAVNILGHCVSKSLDLLVQEGERLAILGPNGAGKSTLLSTLSGLRHPDAGKIFFAGKALSVLTHRERALHRAYLPQFQLDAFDASVLDIALSARHPHLARWQWEGAADKAIALSALSQMGLSGMEKRFAHTLSGGERQRLAMATLLTQDTPLCLLDEPLAHLDLPYQIAVLENLRVQSDTKNRAFVMVLHDPALAFRYCHHALLLYGDGTTEAGTVSEMLTAEKLSRLYRHPLLAVDVDGKRLFVPK